jgi:signal peptidase I
VVVVAAIGPVAGWWHYEVIESGSMTPALRVGGIAVLWPEPVSSVRAGQIIAFHPPGEGNYVRIHRVVAVTERDGQVWVRTKGDANNVADPGPVRLDGKTAYAEHYFVPYLGYLGVWLYKQSTRVALEVVLFTLMVAGGLFLIWSKKDPAEEKDETIEKELVIPARWPRQKQGRALPQRLVVDNLVTEHLVTEHLVTEHLVTEHLVTEHLVTEHLVTEHLVREPHVGDQLGARNRTAEHRAAEKLLAEKASAASAVSLLALSHIYTASSKGGDVAPTADEPVTEQQASTGG